MTGATGIGNNSDLTKSQCVDHGSSMAKQVGISGLVKLDWSDGSLNWSEDALQAAVAQELRYQRSMGARFDFAADQNAGKRSKRDGARRKQMGMESGEPDLRIYLSDGRIVLVELKARKGTASKEQSKRIGSLRCLGHDVRLHRSNCPAEAVESVLDVLREFGVNVRERS